MTNRRFNAPVVFLAAATCAAWTATAASRVLAAGVAVSPGNSSALAIAGLGYEPASEEIGEAFAEFGRWADGPPTASQDWDEATLDGLAGFRSIARSNRFDSLSMDSKSLRQIIAPIASHLPKGFERMLVRIDGLPKAVQTGIVQQMLTARKAASKDIKTKLWDSYTDISQEPAERAQGLRDLFERISDINRNNVYSPELDEASETVAKEELEVYKAIARAEAEKLKPDQAKASDPTGWELSAADAAKPAAPSWDLPGARPQEPAVGELKELAAQINGVVERADEVFSRSQQDGKNRVSKKLVSALRETQAEGVLYVPAPPRSEEEPELHSVATWTEAWPLIQEVRSLAGEMVPAVQHLAKVAPGDLFFRDEMVHLLDSMLGPLGYASTSQEMIERVRDVLKKAQLVRYIDHGTISTGHDYERRIVQPKPSGEAPPTPDSKAAWRGLGMLLFLGGMIGMFVSAFALISPNGFLITAIAATIGASIFAWNSERGTTRS